MRPPAQPVHGRAESNGETSRSTAEVRRLLFVSPVYPHPLDRGQHVRIHHLVLACTRDHAVTLLVPRPEPGQVSAELEAAVAQVVHVDVQETGSRSDLSALVRRFRTLRRPSVAAVLLSYAHRLEELDLDAFTLVWVERMLLAGLFKNHRDRLVIDLDDLEHRKSWRAVKVQTRSIAGEMGPTLRHLYYAVRFFLSETRATRRIASAVVASADDALYLRRCGVRAAFTIPNGVELPPDLPRQSRPGTGRLLFLGNLAYEANRDALTVIRDQIVPLLQAEGWTPAVEVVGPGATEELRRQHPQMVFRGFVADLSAVLGDYDMLLAPLRMGGGTKLKVLDAMANGLPVVTTPIGAEGLGLVAGVDALIASSPAGLAEGVVQVLRDPALARSLAEHARAVAQEFGWDKVRTHAAQHLLTLQPHADQPSGHAYPERPVDSCTPSRT